ncbi:hypothetical protein FKM82_023406 [Ascaphus truei]
MSAAMTYPASVALLHQLPSKGGQGRGVGLHVCVCEAGSNSAGEAMCGEEGEDRKPAGEASMFYSCLSESPGASPPLSFLVCLSV